MLDPARAIEKVRLKKKERKRRQMKVRTEIFLGGGVSCPFFCFLVLFFDLAQTEVFVNLVLGARVDGHGVDAVAEPLDKLLLPVVHEAARSHHNRLVNRRAAVGRLFLPINKNKTKKQNKKKQPPVRRL